VKIQTYPVLLGLALAVSAQAADHRLAYSEANQLQVFVEHPDNSAWCSEKLSLRFADPGAANQVILAQMMPRIGALIERECSSATELTWHSVGADDQILQTGTSSAAGGWALVEAKPAVATPTAPAAPAVEPAAVANTEPAPAPAPEQSAAKESPAQVAVATQTQQQPATPPASPAAEAPAETSAAEPVAEQAVEAVAEKAPEPVEAPEPAPAPAVADSAPAATPVATMFSISGWQPRTSAQTLAETTFATPLRDQNNCLFNTRLQLDVQPEYLKVLSDKVSCDADGLASGAGSLTVTRSDGASLGKITGHWHQGIAFTGGQPDFTIQHIRDGHALYGLLSSDPLTRTHYLIEASHQRDGTWSLQSPRIIVLTDNPDLVRHAESINDLKDRAFKQATALTDRHTSSIRILVVNNPEAVFAGKSSDDSWLYETRLSRGWSNNWSTGYTTNHLFDREARLAREQAQAEARARRERELRMRAEAREQERYLQSYFSISQQPLEQRISEWITEPDSRSYINLMKGGTTRYQQIVRVTGKHRDGGWQVEEPYEAILETSEDLKKGWYQVTGEVRVDPARLDKQKLPLSLIQPKHMAACENRTCDALFDPQAIIAAMSGQPDWSEEKARDLIERVENGQFD